MNEQADLPRFPPHPDPYRDGKPHEFTEDVADASMCTCGVPALDHDDLVVLTPDDDLRCFVCGTVDCTDCQGAFS